MTFESSNFGDGSVTGSGNVTTQVNTHFGVRASDDVQGSVKTEGQTKQLVFEVDAAAVTATGFPLLAPSLPARAFVRRAYINVTEAFALGGTTPTLEIGTEGSEATDGFSITEAQAEAVGVVDVTAALSGTWSTGIVGAAVAVGIASAGAGFTVGTAGRMTVTVEYLVALNT